MGRRALRPVRRQRLHETIATHLEEMILAGEYEPGEPLPTEHEMAEQLQVSRTVVRDAIRVLATKGLVDIRHGVGTFVTQSGRERLAEALELSVRRGDYTPWELFVIRRGLEMTVVEEAIQHATPEDIAGMRQALQDYRQQLFEGRGPSADQHILFHQRMARAAGNRVLMDLLDPITVFRVPEKLGYEGVPPVTQEQQEEYLRRHVRIVDAIEARDVAAARAAMLAHLADLEGRARRATEELRRQSGDGSPRRAAS